MSYLSSEGRVPRVPFQLSHLNGDSWNADSGTGPRDVPARSMQCLFVAAAGRDVPRSGSRVSGHAAVEAEAFFAAGALEPDFVAFDLDDFVSLELVAFAINVVVDDSKGFAGRLGPDCFELPGTDW